MNKQTHAEQRIQMLNKVKKDTNKIQVKDVCEMLAETIQIYFKDTKSGRLVKEKLTEQEFTIFLHGFCNSFLSTLYVNSAKNQKEFKERLLYIDNVNADLLAKKVEHTNG